MIYLHMPTDNTGDWIEKQPYIISFYSVIKPWICNQTIFNAFLAFLSEPGETDSSEGMVSSLSSCQRTPIYKPFTQCRLPIESPPHPAPHSITEEELHFVKTCLQRWRTEVENDINGMLMHITE